MLTGPGRPRAARISGRKDRMILHFDYDCFYASVFENENPSLKSLPLGVKQKSILATCNYVARAKGVNKLMLISEAQKLCPELVLLNGEDLTRFRDASKKLWAFLRSHSWSKRVERLGLDEVFLDVSDIISYNHEILNPNALAQSFFQLSREDPERGFAFDATAFSGCTYPKDYKCDEERLSDPLRVRLVLASHLAGYLRLKLEEDFGYTSTCGISINKVLAKLAGTQNKPKNQTTLISLHDEDVQAFMDAHQIRKIPGMGFKTTHLIENHVLSRTTEAIPHDEDHSVKITTREVLAHPGMSPELVERVLSRPGTEKGIGMRVWKLLHGVDDTEVKEASDVPTQISIEDTYMSKPLNTPSELMRELRALTTSLVKRMHVDLLEQNHSANEAGARKWLAYPKTFRLSTRAKTRPATENQHPFSRNSRSQPLPNFVFSLRDGPEAIVERLVNETVLPLFRRLHHERQGWNLALINICVTNMVLGGNEEGTGGGRDISFMFKTQDARFKDFTVYDSSSAETPPTSEAESPAGQKVATPVPTNFDGEVVEWEEEEEEAVQRCLECGCAIPVFALSAHERFHVMGA
ncbi:putative UmuC domain-containing protein [Seiridium cardinale]